MLHEINSRYDEESKDLVSYSDHLVGKIADEKFARTLLDDNMIQVFQECFEQYLRGIQREQWDCDLQSAWINEMKAGEYNPLHGHGSSAADIGLSSVLMLKKPDTYGVEIKPKDKTNGMLELVGGNQDPLGIASLTVHLEPGDFVVFPFTMLHTVYPFNGTTQKRRTMSFNCDLHKKSIK